MASSVGTGVLCLMVVLCSAVPTSSNLFTVGDSNGWAEGYDYTTWTRGKTFTVGDILVFNYSPDTHTVKEVSRRQYKYCTSGNSTMAPSGATIFIPLKTTGAHYFICVVPGHCEGGMKLSLNVSRPGAIVLSYPTILPLSSSAMSKASFPLVAAVVTCVVLFKFVLL